MTQESAALKSNGQEKTGRPQRLLPREYFFDQEIHRREMRQIFARTWRWVAHQSELPNPGDYLTVAVADESIVVLRDREGMLRAFYNVCQHRASRLLQGRGNLKGFITCPYHSWSYDDKGCLRAAAKADEVAGFDKAQFGLSPVRLEVWLGFIFVNLDASAELLTEIGRELEAMVRRICPEPETLRLAERQDVKVQTNWKTLIDNFVESYHLALSGPCHKAFTDLVDCRNFEVKTYGGGRFGYLFSSHLAPAGPANNTAFSYSKARTFSDNNDFLSIHLFPDIGFVFFPGTDALSVFLMNPEGAESTSEVFAYYTKDGMPDEDTKRGIHYFTYELGREDNELCENVQRGLRSQGYRGGIYMIDADRSGTSEHAVRSFHGQVRACVEAQH
jgi:phenylpropionate dioxygenase-like ring-hydroxylating dioxygenase large terminal subunit